MNVQPPTNEEEGKHSKADMTSQGIPPIQNSNVPSDASSTAPIAINPVGAPAASTAASAAVTSTSTPSTNVSQSHYSLAGSPSATKFANSMKPNPPSAPAQVQSQQYQAPTSAPVTQSGPQPSVFSILSKPPATSSSSLNEERGSAPHAPVSSQPAVQPTPVAATAGAGPTSNFSTIPATNRGGFGAQPYK